MHLFLTTLFANRLDKYVCISVHRNLSPTDPKDMLALAIVQPSVSHPYFNIMKLTCISF